MVLHCNSLKIDLDRLVVDDPGIDRFFGLKVDHLDAFAFAPFLFGHSFDRYFQYGALGNDLNNISSSNDWERLDLIQA